MGVRAPVSILSEFEDRVGGAIEGFFAGAFRSHVQPVEIAKALARQMDDGRAVGVGRVYAPVTFTVSLSVADRDKFAGFQEVLAGELSTYLINHAREQAYHLASKPKVVFETGERLKMGRFLVSADLAPSTPPEGSAHEPEPPVLATVTVGETRHDVTLSGRRVVVGRLADCDICVEDANASRQHAAFVQVDDAWHVEDLGSTNGTKVNGGRIAGRVPLADGDVIGIGITRLVFHRRGN